MPQPPFSLPTAITTHTQLTFSTLPRYPCAFTSSIHEQVSVKEDMTELPDKEDNLDGQAVLRRKPLRQRLTSGDRRCELRLP